MDMITPDVVNAILAKAREVDSASIFEGNTARPFEIQGVTLDLSTAKDPSDPFKINFPFKSIYISTATDTGVSVNFRPNSRDSFQTSVPLSLKDSHIFTKPISGGFLDWSAQSGKTITILFFLSSEFRSGSQISVTSGGLVINEGTSVTTSPLTLVAATSTQVVAADTTRKNLVVQNNTGADVWFGPVGVTNTGATLGIKVGAGGSFVWKNTAALYAYSVAGGAGDSGLLRMSEA